MAALEKIYPCMSCRQEIRLERDEANQKWLKWNLDGTPHIDERNKKSCSNNNGSQQQIAELSKQISELKETINILITQIQSLRSEVRKELKQ